MIRFDAVGKTYTTLITRKEVRALTDFSMTIERGEVIGIAGPNGAGKSTLISLLMGFLHPTAGEIRVDGQQPRAYVERHGISYLTELVNLPPRWKVTPALRRMATLSGVSRDELDARTVATQTELGLDEHAGKTVKQLSKGNLQRLGLAQALIGDFDVVVLDEPTHGLDPLWTQRFRDVVVELRRPDRVILIASHNLDELERLADRVAILNKGQLQRIVAHGGGDASAAAMSWRIAFEGTPEITAVFPGALPVTGRPGVWHLSATRAQLSVGLSLLLAGGAILIECAPEESSLETAFRAAVQG